MLMSRKRNIKKEMFQPTTECVDSLTIDDLTGQAVPESGTGRTECSVANSCKPHSRCLQSMCPCWSEPMPARHVSYADKVVGQVLRSQSMQRSEDQHRQLELYALRCAQPVKAGEHLSDVVWVPKTGDGSGSGVEHRLEVTTQGGRDSDQGGVPVVQATQY